MKQNELKTKVEEIKKDEQVQRALQQHAITETEEPPLRARIRDKLVIGTHITLLVVLGVVHQIISIRFSWIYDRYERLVEKLIIAVAVAVGVGSAVGKLLMGSVAQKILLEVYRSDAALTALPSSATSR